MYFFYVLVCLGGITWAQYFATRYSGKLLKNLEILPLSSTLNEMFVKQLNPKIEVSKNTIIISYN